MYIGCSCSSLSSLSVDGQSTMHSGGGSSWIYVCFRIPRSLYTSIPPTPVSILGGYQHILFTELSRYSRIGTVKLWNDEQSGPDEMYWDGDKAFSFNNMFGELTTLYEHVSF